MQGQPIASLVLGPIIGKVTHNTARILIEVQCSTEISCFLTSPSGKVIVCRTKTEQGRPTLFKFSELEPKTKYIVTLEYFNNIQSGFTTLREENDNPGNLRVGVVSCNEISIALAKQPQQDLWNDLVKKVQQNELDYLLHIGDQWYMDSGDSQQNNNEPYQVCKTLLESIPKNKWEAHVPYLLDVIRNKVRRTWSHRPTAYVLANIPNLTMLDDHEVRDDWGFRPEDSDKNSEKCDYFYGQLARQVYYEYQRQLREDIDWKNLDKLSPEYHDHILNGVGIFFVDYRGSRTWFREEKVEETHLGVKQIEWLKQLFSPTGKFANVNSVLFVSTIPVVYLCPHLDKLATIKNDDAKEAWVYKNTIEMTKLFNFLLKWKKASSGREITFVGGDLHVGAHTEILYKGKGVFKQLIASAINNNVISKTENMIIKLFAEKCGKLPNKYSFKHYDLTRFNNYGIIEIRNQDGTSYVACSLVKSGPKGIVAERPITNKKWESSSCGCNLF